MGKGLDTARSCNIIYDTPGKTCRSAMPIGNGELAASVWTADGKIEMFLGRSDALSEIERTLKLGKISISFSPNPFRENFSQVLDLTEGSIKISGREGSCCVFIGESSDSLYVTGKFNRRIRIQAEYETWRDRELYIKNEFTEEDIPESADHVERIKEGILFYHRNENSIVEETIRNQSMEEYKAVIPDFLKGRIFGGLMLGAGETESDSICIAVHTRSAIESPTDFYEHLDNCCRRKADIQEEYRLVTERWHHFWEKSYICVKNDEPCTARMTDEMRQYEKEPEGFRCECKSQITRAYTLTKYMTACCSGGKFPVLYNGLLFQQQPAEGCHFNVMGFGKSYTGLPGETCLECSPDERSWAKEQLWQNLRHPYFTMLVTGDADKLKILFRYFRNFWEVNRARAKKYYKAEGQHSTEMTLTCGLQSVGIYGKERTDKAAGYADNRWGGAVDISPGLELVNLMLDYYDYTKDKQFLKEELLVYARELLLYIETRFKNRCDGKLVVGPLQAIETYWDTINPITVVAGMHAVLHRILKLPAETGAELDYFREYVPKLPDIPESIENGKKILKPAMAYAEERHNVEPPEYYTVFPFNLVKYGIVDKETALHTFRVRTEENGLMRPFVLGECPDTPSYCGWQYIGVVAARLGLTDVCKEILSYNCSLYNPGYRFPAMWGPVYDAVPDVDHGANIMNLLHHMIFSVEGENIQILPAFPEEWEAEYRLFLDKDTVVEGTGKDYRIIKTG